jgi:DNA mismatch repair ATPase MutL
MKPLALELSPQEEHCIVENMSEFERNGFRFVYDNEKPPRHRLSLTAIPHSGSGGDGKKAILFGKEDVKALCSILGVDDTTDCSLQWWGGEQGKYGNNAVRRYGAGQHDTLLSSTQDSMGEKRVDSNVAGRISGKKLARLPKAIAMFASRACRSSIMIGDGKFHS